MSRVVVLEDGPFRIEWNGGHTYNVVLLGGQDVNVFSSDYGENEDETQACEHAREWWTTGGKEATQEVIRESDL